MNEILKKEMERFEEEFLNKWFPPKMDLLMPDGDSRSMRERGKDFLRDHDQRLLAAVREWAEEQKKEVPLEGSQGYALTYNFALHDLITYLEV